MVQYSKYHRLIAYQLRLLANIQSMDEVLSHYENKASDIKLWDALIYQNSYKIF